jgi:ribosome maturation factor RimP
MIIQTELEKIIHEFLEGSPLFLIETSIRSGNRISVYIDGDQGVTIDDCRSLNRHLEAALDRDREDFDLTVSSAGADRPLKLPRQYKRFLNRELLVETTGGATHSGTLASASDQSIELEVIEKISKKEHKVSLLTIPYADMKTARVIISFKK